ncbi:MAG TPA: 50S ribosomal protein L14e [Candidatus Woesearchaeota archaeon]|nr:50S ribosomal protein L14e [Candidatus Woesearchaeota archaeon]
MVEVGRVAIKLRGREAGKKAVIVEIVDGNFVVIDGNVKRKRCNVDHLALLPEKLQISSGESSESIKKIFKEKGWLKQREAKVANKKERKGAPKPRKQQRKKGKQKETAEPKKQVKKQKKMTKEDEDRVVEATLAAAEKQ